MLPTRLEAEKQIREIKIDDIPSVLPLYITYYNENEDGCWTETTAGKRIHQVLSMEDSYGLVLEKDDQVIGFVMGFFKQYDDIVGYTLEEIVIAKDFQNQGLGSFLLNELEQRAKEKGASCVELQAVNDEMHEKYYGKAGYYTAANFVMKAKWFE
ncbi:GNAT family N-acetyltransferase [Butyrivibrio sp. LC3010]|uniref:GNAT family N-acetyltransferase n=1 Tax=Butyrivibrio sp. LC3010 TaxID=1280680 RepID=UPI000427ABFA|nr:GNAT family N-acetyltransferase [Butyrivibrio sp. LC3010]